MAKIDVAPLVGAWIEMQIVANALIVAQSLPSWERGLKCVLSIDLNVEG